jgi:C_GCAxxG_C_C family probable redox protein
MENNRRNFVKIAAAAVAVCPFYPFVGFSEKKAKSSVRGMSTMERILTAHSLFGNYRNCCTGVFAAYAPELGVDENLAVRLTRAMPGIGSSGLVCGAVSGATMVIGLKTTNENNAWDLAAQHESNSIVRDFIAKFEEKHSSTNCRELLGRDISSQAKFDAAVASNAFINCPKLVKSAVTILDDIFEV